MMSVMHDLGYSHRCIKPINGERIIAEKLSNSLDSTPYPHFNRERLDEPVLCYKSSSPIKIWGALTKRGGRVIPLPRQSVSKGSL